MERISEIRAFLLRTFRELRIQRRLYFDSALPRLYRDESTYIADEIEDSDTESSSRTTEGFPTPSHQLLLKRVNEFIGEFTGHSEAISLLFQTMLHRLERLETKIAFLQTILQYEAEGSTDTEASDTEPDEEND